MMVITIYYAGSLWLVEAPNLPQVCILAADALCLDVQDGEQSNGSLGNHASPLAWQFGTASQGVLADGKLADS